MPPESIDPGIRLRTERLLLRPMRPDDRAEFVRVYAVSTKHFRPWEPLAPSEQTVEELFESQLERAVAGLASGSACRLVGELTDRAGEPAGRIAGFFNLNNITRGVFQSADAGWKVSTDATGLGLGTQGVRGLLDLAFAPPPHGLGLHRVQANIIPRNVQSLRVADKAGFRLEGFGRRMLRINGVWEDHQMFAKLSDEHEPVYLTGASGGDAAAAGSSEGVSR